MYYVVLDSGQSRTRILERLRNSGIGAISHYVPLHSSPAGQLFGRVHGEMVNTDFIGENLFRLPLWIGLDPQDQKVIVEVLTDTL
jgi:dTDP-4-amino-4,6-dideoxygalactose transaminase